MVILKFKVMKTAAEYDTDFLLTATVNVPLNF